MPGCIVPACIKLRRTLVLAATLCPALFAANLFGADLPVREVILYKHGVGFFERSGELKPGETARLDFKAGDMNDVLKSLTITDRNGGKIGGVRYDASESLDKRLEDFPFTLGQQASLAAFLDQMKGAQLEIKLGAETIAGTIAGARVVESSDKGQPVQREPVHGRVRLVGVHHFAGQHAVPRQAAGREQVGQHRQVAVRQRHGGKPPGEAA